MQTAAALSPLEWGDTLSAAPVVSGRPSPSAPVLVRRWRGVSPDIEQPPLDHHYATLHLGGAKRIRRRGEGGSTVRTIDEGAYSLTPSGSAFSWRTEGPVDFAHVYLPPSSLDAILVGEFDRDPRALTLQDALGARDPLIEALLMAMTTAVASGEQAGRLYWEGLLHTLTHRLLTAHTSLATGDDRAPLALAPYRVRRITDYVEANLCFDVSLNDLAHQAGVSPFHFSRAFRQATGRSPYAFLIHRRMERAKDLLGSTDLPIASVGLACGYASLAHFSAAFRKTCGVRPSRWRALA